MVREAHTYDVPTLLYEYAYFTIVAVGRGDTAGLAQFPTVLRDPIAPVTAKTSTQGINLPPLSFITLTSMSLRISQEARGGFSAILLVLGSLVP